MAIPDRCGRSHLILSLQANVEPAGVHIDIDLRVEDRVNIGLEIDLCWLVRLRPHRAAHSDRRADFN